MREILFRGKNDRDEWVEGFYIKDYIGTYIYDKYRNTRMQSVLPETVGQYTGETDKNGKKIFEGDIVRTHLYNGKYYEEITGVITYAEGHMGFGIHNISESEIDFIDAFHDPLEVIGNAIDNPELLEGVHK